MKCSDLLIYLCDSCSGLEHEYVTRATEKEMLEDSVEPEFLDELDNIHVYTWLAIRKNERYEDLERWCKDMGVSLEPFYEKEWSKENTIVFIILED